MHDSAYARIWQLLPWIIGTALIWLYLRLPVRDEPLHSAVEPVAAMGESQEKLEVVDVRPMDPTPGSAVVIRYTSSNPSQPVQAFLGRQPLETIEHPAGAIVARLPSEAALGHHKIRVASGAERSKPYDIKIQALDWRKRFRNLVGGLALLLLGIDVLGRGIRKATGLGAAARLASLARRPTAALLFGGFIGALVQSTTSAAGLLGALVSSNLLGLAAASVGFLGALLATTAAPFLLTAVVAPNEGLIAIALGVAGMGLARGRRTKAVGQLVLGAGLMSFGLHVLRPGFEPLLSEPWLVQLFDGLKAREPASVIACVGLGIVLSAVLQGPAPAFLFIVSLAETTGVWDLPTAVTILSGSALGAALGALVAMPREKQGRRFVALNVLVCAIATLLAAASAPIWCHLSDLIVRGYPEEVRWGQRVLLPNVGVHLLVACTLSQLATTALVLPGLPALSRWISRDRAGAQQEVGSGSVQQMHSVLGNALRAEQKALDPITELALKGDRTASRRAEQQLGEARRALERVLADSPNPAEAGLNELRQAIVTCLQLQGSLEALLQQTERLTEARLTATADTTEAIPLRGDDERTLRELEALLGKGMEVAIASLESGVPLDVDEARAREISINAVEARVRGALSAESLHGSRMKVELCVLEWVGACEIIGNHIYRLGQTLAELTTLAGPQRA
jgi:hypothetical protein